MVSVGMFRRRMAALSAGMRSGPNGRWVLMPPKPEDMAHRRRRSIGRRRRFLLGLLASSGLTFLLGLASGRGHLMLVHAGVDVLLAVYVVLLVKTRPRRRPVRRGGRRPQRPEEEPDLLRAGQL